MQQGWKLWRADRFQNGDEDTHGWSHVHEGWASFHLQIVEDEVTKLLDKGMVSWFCSG